MYHEEYADADEKGDKKEPKMGPERKNHGDGIDAKTFELLFLF